MKYHSLTLLSLLSFSISLTAQTIHRVNNNAGVSGVNVYETIQAAHDAASNGDIILVEPSATSYGNLKCAKSLRIYGNGYYLDASQKANNLSSRLGNVEFVPGSNGSEIYGCETGYFWIEAASDIKISRNLCGTLYIDCFYTPGIGSTQFASVSNIIFSQNYSDDIDIKGAADNSTTYHVSNFSITNNYIGTITTTSDVASGVIKYNTIEHPVVIKLHNIVFENNIVILTSGSAQFDASEPLAGSFTSSNSSLNYNITSGAVLFGAGLGTGNQNGIDLSEHFVFGPNDHYYELHDASSLKTSGSDGGEVGMFGGSTPYLTSGIPAVPSITTLKTTGTGSNSTPITVTFSAKSNN